ncbi:anthranilate synthase component II [Lepagella muris]|jgi:anthranilate synthase component 2|uniref:Aminodeoxychorismate/anthranilate synthase component II n=1 Tax=Lepagella muris TaxID=3032870 RepID=A0AC61RG71_9BACT|nr:aminodeoxychorismate/anthranilate synthase component II [Lepagella muris]ROT07725.1 aminodeoxychorismate/anthranilate synthase component II [Muribaculaceae bacterium Isolate-037 (Harlan)]TGY78829.1 aminodeoxychorismate/anthranilate synthase component II [Lepagella muris]THG52269.1 aminodeoxychorismate/anthranilate synthase component II [Bacteroidales bacterium]TKC60503.1 aminodeoxychorismate/anthranilate synthase component II [Bacteroidales bacterium]
MKLLILDNYDSFTYNIVHAVRELGITPTVVRNDKITLPEIDEFDKIIISPGPGIPSEAGILPELLREYAGKKPILGVCLGHQAIGENFGATLENLDDVYHGVQTMTHVIADDYIVKGMGNDFPVGRYHSWIVSEKNLPESLVVTSVDDAGKIMSLRHKDFDIHGVQFHPESLLTPGGNKIISNFLMH